MKNFKITNIIPILIGIVSFFTIYGSSILNPKNIGWLSDGDLLTYYLGWSFFRKSDWTFPVGLNPDYGLELGNSIVYSDSNPLLAIFFKLFSSILPDTFQYFGLWLLICLVLQAWFGWKLTKIISGNIFFCMAGTLLFVFCPPLICRLGHINLCGHFLILASLYFAFSQSLENRKLKWGILLSVAVLVHAYLLVMVMMIWIGDLLGRKTVGELGKKQMYAEIIISIALVFSMAYLAGYFSVIRGVMATGYGYYRLNLLSIVNPAGYSYILGDIAVGPGDYEGFNYLGFGILFLLVTSIPAFFCHANQIRRYVIRYKYLLCVLILLALFSITYVVGLGTFSFRVPFSSRYFNIFRASGRFFWPVFYTIIFFILFVTVRFYSRKTAMGLLGMAVILQVTDTSAGWIPQRESLQKQSLSEFKLPFKDSFWSYAAGHYEKLRFIMPANHSRFWKEIAEFACKHNIKTDAIYLGRMDQSSLERLKEKSEAIIATGNLDSDTFYILDDESYRQFLDNHSTNTNFIMANIDGYHVLVPATVRNSYFAKYPQKYKDVIYNNKHVFYAKSNK